MHRTGNKTFAAYLESASAHQIAELRLGKKTEELYAHDEKLHRQIDSYAYSAPHVRFTEADVDQARAAGALIEFERGRPIIVDRSLYRELVTGAIERTHDELQAKAAPHPPNRHRTFAESWRILEMEHRFSTESAFCWCCRLVACAGVRMLLPFIQGGDHGW